MNGGSSVTQQHNKMLTSTSGILNQKQIYPLNLVSNTNLAGAWSNRKLISTYSGGANKVRRSSNNQTIDIGFLNNDYDTSTLSSHVGGSSGFVTTWYDQSGNSRTLSQSTTSNQPRIVNAGTNDTINGKICNFYNGTSTSLGTSNIITGITTNNNLSIFLVFQKTAGGYVTVLDQGRDAAYYNFGIASNYDNGLRFRNTNMDYTYGTNINTLSDKLVISVINIGANSECFRNGVSIGSTANGTSSSAPVIGEQLTIGKRGGHTSEYLTGNICEIMIFTRNLSTTERQLIERNMGAYYGITVT